MSPAIYKQVTIEVEGQQREFIFRVTDTTPIFDGFTTIYEETQEDTNSDEESSKQKLPSLQVNEELLGKDFSGAQHFTKPPARYTEASLIRALEEKGIGRPSTYAPTMKTIRDRGYVVREKGRLKPTSLGEEVNRLLTQLFPDILDYNFTAKMEEDLDEIEEGKLTWQNLLQRFNEAFKNDLTERKKTLFGKFLVKMSFVKNAEPFLKCAKDDLVSFLRVPIIPNVNLSNLYQKY
jgi:DNA topoisomerase-1